MRAEGGALEVVAITSAELVQRLAAAGLIEGAGRSPRLSRWRISAAGIALLEAAPCAPAPPPCPPLPVEADPFPRIPEIRAILSGRIDAPAREALLSWFEAVAADPEPAIRDEWEAIGCRFSREELAVADRLARSAGAVVPASLLLRAMMGARVDRGELPGRDHLRMALRRVRAKLAGAGLPVELRTIRGRGAVLVVNAPGFMLPGQSEQQERAA